MSFDFEAGFFVRMLAEAGERPARVLVVGCGDGTEAGHIARRTGAVVVGLDLDVDARALRPGVHLLRADARRLPFRDGTFGALYCYHVLEHIPGPVAAVAEARRVVTAGAVAYFGTPNKSRWVGYLGGRGTTREKLRWNLHDWQKRLQGRWSNEQGAHAGFTAGELARLLRGAYSRVEAVSLPYYVNKYPRLEWLWRAFFRSGLARFVAPSVYFVARVQAPGPAR